MGHRPRGSAVVAAVGIAAALAVTGAAPAAAAPPAPGEPATVFVELDGPSAVQEFRAQRDEGIDRARRAAREARSRIDSLADELLARFRGAEGTNELFRTTNAVPGVALRATPATVRELAAQPGVRSVRRITPARPTNASAVQLGRAVDAWQQTGRLGEGVRIGIVDTGIDYTHADFGGPGTAAAYEAVDPTRVDPQLFPNEKVVGGVDLAGDDYDADSDEKSRTVPQPDPNPLDCQGHGTHVAGTAAGYGVTADGEAFRGDYANLTPGLLQDMRIGPGAAPAAELYGIRVFGCSGSTALTALALDHALDPDGDGDFSDRLDVVNLSLGSAFGAVDDPVNDFVRVLTQHGVLVVAAAGNDGDVFDAGGSPGNAPEALAVASVRDAGVLLDGLNVLAPDAVAGPVAGQYSIEYDDYDTLDVAAPVVELGGADAEGCEPYDPADAARVRGAIVWLAWSDLGSERSCGSAPRADNAAAAGAVGALLTSQRPEFGSTRIAGNAEIPMFQLTGPATAALRPALAAGALRVRLAGELRGSQQITVPELEDTVSAFTSRGVRGPTVKPDVAGPGETITSAASGTGAGRSSKSGTSMSSPFVAGVAALVREEYPDRSPAEVKAAIMGTATADVLAADGERLAPMRVGAGRVDARAALATPVLAANAEEPVAVSVTFGALEVPPGAPLVRREQIRVTNSGAVPVALAATYEPVTRMPGVRYDVTPEQADVPPGGAALLDVAVRVDDPSALRRTPDPTLELVQEGRPRQYVADASGHVVLTPQDGDVPTLRVPVSAAPEPVSDLSADLDDGTLSLRGTGLDQGSGTEAYRSRVGVFALAASSPELPVCSDPDAVSGCVVNDTGRGGDLRYVGVRSTAPTADDPDEALLAFAVTTWADLYNVGSFTRPVVEISTDGDDVPDFATALTKLPDTDVLVARTLDLHASEDGEEVDVHPVNGLDGDGGANVFDTNAWVLPVRLAALGIDPAAPSAPLRFSVAVAGDYGPPASDEGVVDALEAPVAFDPLAPGFSVRPTEGGVDPSALLFPADDGSVLDVDGSASLLVVLGRNASGDRVSVLGDGMDALLAPVGQWSSARFPR
ncbi:S8 family serine peptidase [Pseudonocardia nigra]|uniref:S8 family serine peptidase n=1 Tax=Pseudonocardia nigra TaxID=1921578 RepID=UPI0027E2951B|nr:S8 family serine peptidase [Pseudonocardia nigra]